MPKVGIYRVETIGSEKAKVVGWAYDCQDCPPTRTRTGLPPAQTSTQLLPAFLDQPASSFLAMAFRKRNIAVGRQNATAPGDAAPESIPGVRPSPLTSHPVTSTGTPSLDSLLGGHAGLAVGSSLLVEESGTTDFAGALLRYYAAEGICQGHVLHVVGMGEGWVRELPGVAEEKKSSRSVKSTADEEKMKIAWRYEKLGQAGERGALDTLA